MAINTVYFDVVNRKVHDWRVSVNGLESYLPFPVATCAQPRRARAQDFCILIRACQPRCEFSP